MSDAQNGKPGPDLEQLEGYSSFFSFLRRGVQPPSQVYIERDDTLRIEMLAPITTSVVSISIRLMQPDGQVTPLFQQYTVTAPQATLLVRVIDGLEGFLLSVSVSSDTVLRGQCWVRMLLQRGQGSSDLTRGLVIVQGYTCTMETLSWPNGRLASSIEDRGAMRAILGADPAAGAEITETVPAGVTWILRSFSVVLVADATVATREPSLFVDNGAAIVPWRAPPALGITAGLTKTITWSPGNTVSSTTVVHTAGMAAELRLLPGWRIRTNTLALQAGDNFGAPSYLVEEFCAP